MSTAFLFARHAEESLQEVLNVRAAFEVLEPRSDGDARSFEQPLPADFFPARAPPPDFGSNQS
jgi:hypothetical protein